MVKLALLQVIHVVGAILVILVMYVVVAAGVAVNQDFLSIAVIIAVMLDIHVAQRVRAAACPSLADRSRGSTRNSCPG